MGREKLIGSTAQDRGGIAREAALPPLSVPSVLAGTLSAYGAVTVLALLTAAGLDRADVNVDFSSHDWTSSAVVGSLGAAVVLLVAFLFGGYVAGRMAARSGLANGVAVAVLGIVGGVAVGWAVAALSDATIASDLHIRVPTASSGWSSVSWTASAVSLAAVVVGALFGAFLGLRWHTRLVRRLADPSIGASAEARRRADALEADRHRYVDAVSERGPSSGSDESRRNEEGPSNRPLTERGGPERPERAVDEDVVDLRTESAEAADPRLSGAEARQRGGSAAREDDRAGPTQRSF